MKIYAIANHKGGVGKTTTAVNLAALMARDGKHVLLIDADAQHNATDFFEPAWEGLTLTDLLAPSPGVEDMLVGRLEAENFIISGVRPRLDLVPADEGLLTLSLNSVLADDAPGGDALAGTLSLFLGDLEERKYDYCIIDCPPSYTPASVAALTVADEVIIPTRYDAFSRQGALSMIYQAKSLRKLHVSPRFRVLLTMADRTRLCHQAQEQLRLDGLTIFRTVIRASVSVGEASYMRSALYEYVPKSPAAQDYEALAREVLADE